MAEAIVHEPMYEERITARYILGGALAETIPAAGALVLAIVGLAGFMQTQLLTIATIGLGIAFLFEGGTIASRLSELLSEVTENRVDIAELGGGLGAEFLAGLGGIALGVLSLVGVEPMILTSVAAIVFGGAFIFTAGAKARISHLSVGQKEHKLARAVAREVVVASSSLQILVGLGAVVLGILALVNIRPMELILVATLSVAGMILICSAAVGGKMIAAFRR